MTVILLGLCLAACTPQQQSYIEKPDGIEYLEKNIFYPRDMAMLPYRAWLPKKSPRAVVIALHGFNDYSNAFSEVGPYFADNGIAMYAYDLRGFGGSKHAGIWGGERNYVNDLKQFAGLLRKQHAGISVYVLGESMGGAVASVALVQNIKLVDGLILTAPAFWGGDSLPFIYRSTLWLSAHVAPHWEMTGSDLDILASNNIPMLRKMAADPLIIKSTRIDSVYGLTQLMDSAYTAIPKLKLPILVLYGGKDEVIKPAIMKLALARFSQPVTYIHYPEAYHMLLRDLEAEIPMRDIVSWIKQPKKPAPSGFSSIVVH